MFFLQMSGIPGSGKSTLAREIARQTGAVIVDHDVTKTALLKELTDIDSTLAGKTSYNIDWAIVESNLSVGNSTILDSPCLYQTMIVKGEALSKQYKAKYKYVECYLDDFAEINNRLKQREKLPSQVREITSEVVFRSTIIKSKKPMNYPILVIDTKQPFESYIDNVIHYVKE